MTGNPTESTDFISFYHICVGTVIAYTILGWLVPLGIAIGYGRLKNSFFKAQLNPRIAWFLFEVPNLIWAFYFLFIQHDQMTLAYGLFILHYINRDIIYPLRLKSTNKVPLEIIFSAASFTFANGYIQGIANHKQNSQQREINQIVQILGVLIFFTGMYINVRSDEILRSSKKKLKTDHDSSKANGHGYVVINQFLFKYVSSPNYFGEIIEWLGYFLVCQRIQGFLFFFSTLNILTAAAIPRNKWNKKNIEGYPSDRKIVIPLLL